MQTSFKMNSAIDGTINSCVPEKSLKCLFCHGKNKLCHKKVTPAMKKYQGFSKFDEDITKGKWDGVAILPEDVLLKIFCCLEQYMLLTLRLVSKKWKRISEDKQLWYSINFSCQQIHAFHFMLNLPYTINKNVCIVNMMWSVVSPDVIRKIIQKFTNMEVFLLRHSVLTTTRDEFIKKPGENVKVPELEILDLRNVRGEWVQILKNVSTSKLKSLAFSETLNIDWFQYIPNYELSQLQMLEIKNNPSLNDEILSRFVYSTPNLVSMNIQGCLSVNGSFLSRMRNLNKLKLLDVNGTRVGGVQLSKINWKSLSLEAFNLSFCCKISEKELLDILPCLKHLTDLKLSFVGWGRAFTDKVIREMIKNNINRLRSIEIHSNFCVSSKGLGLLFKSCKDLQNLRLGSLVKTESEFDIVSQGFPMITSLSIQLGDSLIQPPHLFRILAKNCRNLESIYIFNLRLDQSLKEDLVSSLTQLFTLCTKLKNMLTGDYGYTKKVEFQQLVISVTKEIGTNINIKKPVSIIPHHWMSFDSFVCENVGKRSFERLHLSEHLQQVINSQSFYRSGLQKMDEFFFANYRNLD